MTTLLYSAIEASIEAGREIMKIYTQDFEVNYKTDQSPLTAADLKSHETIVAKLQATRLPILSEEGKTIDFAVRKHWKRFWIIDPLDGTKEFVKRNGEFTVNIALIENNLPTLGVIYVPVSQKLFFADKTNGSFKVSVGPEYTALGLTQQATKLPAIKKPENYTVAGSRSHMNAETETFINNLQKKHPQLKIVSKGSSLKLCLVAEGKAQIYPRFAPTMEWDTAAGHAIARYANARVLSYPGLTEITYNKENLLNPWFVAERE